MGWTLLLVGGLGPIAILWYLSDYTIDPHTWIWWLSRLSRDVYTPEGQRRLIRWRPLTLALMALQIAGVVILLSL